MGPNHTTRSTFAFFAVLALSAGSCAFATENSAPETRDASAGSDRPFGPGNPNPDAGLITKDGEVDGACGLQRFAVQRAPAEILLVLDRSASMKEKPSGATASDSKWELVVPALTQVLTSTDATISWGYKVFPEGDGKECVAGSVTSAIDVALAPRNADRVNAAIAATTPEGNGTPTGDAVRAAASYVSTLGDGLRHYILLATDGEPSCPDDDAAEDAIDAVQTARTQGIETFVVGIATTKKSATATLDKLAVAGGHPQPAGAPSRYYLASTSSDLVAALGTIAGEVVQCEFDLGTSPPVPDNIAVDLEGVRLARSDSDGWAYVDDSHRRLKLNGPGCEAVRSGQSSSLQIIFGCPDIVIP